MLDELVPLLAPPPAAQFAERTGVAAVVWTPDQWPEVVAALGGPSSGAAAAPNHVRNP